MPEVEKKLGTSPEGLSQAEAERRLTEYGPNELKEEKTNPIPILKFLSYFWGPIPWMIEAAVILSGVVQHWPDFCIILLLLLANALVGFWEERQAGNAIAALKANLAIKARVKRDGKWVNPAARELVPGDVIRMRLGDIVPADARLLDGDPVEVDQSALTGESLPTTRKSGEAVFTGSIIRQGEIGGLVYATGAILSIAYDNVHYKNRPEAWSMRMVLGISTVLGVVGPIAAFGLFHLGDRVFQLDHEHLQPMMYLLLSVAGHLTIFLTRTRGPFWSIRPARILWMAVFGTQCVATLIAVYGFLMPPLGWGWAGFVWVYALIWAILTDRVKLLAYRVFDPNLKKATVPLRRHGIFSM